VSPAANLADQARQLLLGLQAPELAPFLEEWPPSPIPHSVGPRYLPVLRWLAQAGAAAPPFSSEFIGTLIEAAPSLAWRRSYTLAEANADFLDNYGWTEFIGLQGPTPSVHLACGVLLLGPHVTYPAHRHEAEEIYVPLAGTAAWKQGGEDWRERRPGAVIHHALHEPHAMQTLSFPLIALYLWRSKDLAQKSRMEAAPGPT
jgi:hypothetical protein